MTNASHASASDTAPRDLATQVKQLAAQCGYVACGITSTEPFDRYQRELDDRGRCYPRVRSAYESHRRRADPRQTTPWARAIVVGIRWYGKYVLPSPFPYGIGRTYLFDRRYPLCPDHQMPRRMRAGLKQLGLRVKPGGVPERAAAHRAGVVEIGRNGCAYAGEDGSWINIESWRVDAPLPPDTPTESCPCPPGCRACIDGCPSGALEAPYRMRMDRCIAYLSFEEPDPIPSDLWQSMGPWIYGCDRCQEVCPLNEGAWREQEPAPWLEPLLPHLSPERLAHMDNRTYRELIHPAFWYIAPENVERWRRNARRAVGRR